MGEGLGAHYPSFERLSAMLPKMGGIAPTLEVVESFMGTLKRGNNEVDIHVKSGAIVGGGHIKKWGRNWVAFHTKTNKIMGLLGQVLFVKFVALQAMVSYGGVVLEMCLEWQGETVPISQTMYMKINR